MGLLAWLGLKKDDDYPNLDALMGELRRALPDDEAVVLRYIAIVVVLLGKVAYADGRFSAEEEQTLRALLLHIGRLNPKNVEAMCRALRGQIPSFSEEELSLCYRELKSLCDGKERVQVMRLLARLAAVDGALSEAEERELEKIAEEIGVPADELAIVRESVS